MRRRIVLVGATGRTGRLVAAELGGTDRVLLVARDRADLDEVGDALGLPTAVADLDGLAGVLQPGDVVLSAVGPADLVGDAVLGAAIAANATYLDVATEPAFLARLHGAAAREAALVGTCLVPGLGFHGLAGLVAAHEALDPVGDDGIAVTVAYVGDGGVEAAGSGRRRALARTVVQPTTTFHRGRLRTEHVGARRAVVPAGDGRHLTMSVGGPEVWSLPRHHPHLESVDVQAGWFGVVGQAVSLSTRFAGPFRAVGGTRLVDEAVKVLGDGAPRALDEGAGRAVAIVRARDGSAAARREAVGTNPVRVTARLAAAAADRIAATPVGDLPPGAADALAVFGRRGLADLASYAGLAVL